MAYWLMKTEPGDYCWDDLIRDKGTFWDGVRNYQARNNMREMKKGDLCFLYHSVGPKEIVGIARVTKEAYQDPTTDNDAWVCVDIKPVKKLKTPVHLSDIKADKLLSQMALVKNSRLSVCPVTKKEWDRTLKAAGS